MGRWKQNGRPEIGRKAVTVTRIPYLQSKEGTYVRTPSPSSPYAIVSSRGNASKLSLEDGSLSASGSPDDGRASFAEKNAWKDAKVAWSLKRAVGNLDGRPPASQRRLQVGACQAVLSVCRCGALLQGVWAIPFAALAKSRFKFASLVTTPQRKRVHAAREIRHGMEGRKAPAGSAHSCNPAEAWP